MFLSPADIETLTGYKRASAQIRWLNHNGWKFTVNSLGDPVVAIAEFERLMVGGKKDRGGGPKEPNYDWDAINGTRKHPIKK